MKARVAATLICLCGQVLAAPEDPQAPSRDAARPPARPAVAVAAAVAAGTPRQPAPDAAPPRASAPGERALILSGIALMAGIALRRLGDGSP